MLDSTGALDLPEIPKSMLVIGGGYIGLELGSVYAALGTQGLGRRNDRRACCPAPIAILSSHPRAARREDLRAGDAVDQGAVDEGRRRRRDRHLRGRGRAAEATYDYVLVSIGRRPNASIEGSRQDRVQVNDRGFIQTDVQRRTDEPTIFAIGDVAGEPMLAHKASHEARVAVEAIAGHKAVFEPRRFPPWSSPIPRSPGPV